MPDLHGVLRGRRGEASDVVPLMAAPSAMREGKMYAIHIARPDGKHLTVDDYQWIRRCLGLSDDHEASSDLAACVYCGDHTTQCVCREGCDCAGHRVPNGSIACVDCGGHGWTTSDYDIPALRDTCERCDGSGVSR